MSENNDVEAAPEAPAPVEAQAAPDGSILSTATETPGAADTAAPQIPGDKPAESEDGQEATSEDKKPSAEADAFALEIKLPEDIVPDEARTDQFKGTMTGLEAALVAASGDRAAIRAAISNAAQELVDNEVAGHTALQASMAENAEAQTRKWAEETRADPETGGADHERKMAAVSRARDAFATPELIEVLNAHGLGNHPEVVRHYLRIGQKITPDDPSGGGAAKEVPVKTTEEILYGKTG